MAYFVLPAAIIVGAALLLLLLEAAGTPVAFRKAGARTQLVTMAICALVAAGLQAQLTLPEPGAALMWGAFRPDRWSFVGVQLTLGMSLLIMVALVPAARGFAADRGEVLASLLLGTAGTVGLCLAEDVMVVLVALALQGLAAVALLVLDRRTGRGAEAAFKAYFALLIRLLLFGLGAALLIGERGATTLGEVLPALASTNAGGQVGAVLILASLFVGLGLAPFGALAVDVTHGGSSFASGYARTSSLVSAVFLTARVVLVEPGADVAVSAFLAPGLGLVVAVSFVVSALAATDQRDLDRAFAHLMTLQGAVVLAEFLTHKTLPTALAAGATALVASGVSIIGVSTARGAVARTDRLFPTWERWSGVGRKHPYYGLALLICAGSLVGLPGTAGFWSRLEAADAGFENGALVVAAAMVVSTAVASLVVVRLGFFLFAKSPDPRRVRVEIGGWRTMALFLCTALVLVLGLGAQWVSAALERFLAYASFAG